MNQKREFLKGIALSILGILVLLALCLNGCAHTCRPVEDRAAQYGSVLECKDVPGETKTRCLISTADGDVYHFFKACE